MDNSIVVAAIIVVAIIAILALFAPGIRRWIKGKRHRGKGEKIPLFNCSITSKGDDDNMPNSVDVYDCVEADEKDAKTSPKD